MQTLGTHEGTFAEIYFPNIPKAEPRKVMENTRIKLDFSYILEVQILQFSQVLKCVHLKGDVTITVRYVEITDLAELPAKFTSNEFEAL